METRLAGLLSSAESHPAGRHRGGTLALAGVVALALSVLVPNLALAQDGTTGAQNAGIVICFVLLLIVNIAILVWVYRDANARGANGLLWAVLTFFFGLVALIIYLIIRPKGPDTGYRV